MLNAVVTVSSDSTSPASCWQHHTMIEGSTASTWLPTNINNLYVMASFKLHQSTPPPVVDKHGKLVGSWIDCGSKRNKKGVGRGVLALVLFTGNGQQPWLFVMPKKRTLRPWKVRWACRMDSERYLYLVFIVLLTVESWCGGVWLWLWRVLLVCSWGWRRETWETRHASAERALWRSPLAGTNIHRASSSNLTLPRYLRTSMSDTPLRRSRQRMMTKR